MSERDRERSRILRAYQLLTSPPPRVLTAYEREVVRSAADFLEIVFKQWA